MNFKLPVREQKELPYTLRLILDVKRSSAGHRDVFFRLFGGRHEDMIWYGDSMENGDRKLLGHLVLV